MLTPFAKAHLRLLQIQQRWKQVMRRNPLVLQRRADSVRWSETQGHVALHVIEQDQILFDMYVHNRY